MPDKQAALEKLQTIPYPGFSRDIVSFGLVKDLRVEGDEVFVKIEFASEKGNTRALLEPQIRNGLRAIGFAKVNVEILEKTTGAARAEQHFQQQQLLENLLEKVDNTIAVASGKGGVGKSTVSVNLVCALAKLGQKVGILDADVYGPNIPMMLGLEGARPKGIGQQIFPLERDGIKVMSLGFLAPSDSAIIWRGPLVGRAIEQMLRDVLWGELDFLIIDLPPGTGDAQLTLSQKLNLSGAVMVSTPQPVALSDAIKGLRMFQKVNVPVLGLIENMSTFVCDNCHKEHDIFGKGGVKIAAAKEGVPFLGDIPITPELRTGGDTGNPIVLAYPDSIAAKRFMEIAERLIAQFSGQRQEAPKHFKL